MQIGTHQPQSGAGAQRRTRLHTLRPVYTKNILVAVPDKPVAKLAELPVTERLALGSGKIIALGTSFLRRPGRVLSVSSDTDLSSEPRLLPCRTRGHPIRKGKGLHTQSSRVPVAVSDPQGKEGARVSQL